MNGLTLPPDLELFATDAVASGRYRDTNEILRTGLYLVRRQDLARAAFLESVEAAQQDGIENGFHNLDDLVDQAKEPRPS